MYFTVLVHEPLEVGRESSLGIKDLPPLVLKAAIISMTSSLLTHTKLKAELTIQCKIDRPTCLYAVQIHQAWE